MKVFMKIAVLLVVLLVLSCSICACSSDDGKYILKDIRGAVNDQGQSVDGALVMTIKGNTAIVSEPEVGDSFEMTVDQSKKTMTYASDKEVRYYRIVGNTLEMTYGDYKDDYSFAYVFEKQ